MSVKTDPYPNHAPGPLPIAGLPEPGATIAIAMSGGVDSSVAAALLKEAGYQVMGLTMHLFPQRSSPPSGGPKGADPLTGAALVARHLGIPHYQFHMEEVFQEEVISPFLDEYLQGRTPNPCVICNRTIKFRALWEQAQKLGAHYLATGHYLELEVDQFGNRSLLRGADQSKDQSYFLCRLDREILPHLIFPVGNLDKALVSRLAVEMKLPTGVPKESQEACFMEGKSLAEFMGRWVEPARMPPPGPIVDQEGQVLGEHRGIHTLTIGQRRGLGLGGGNPALHVTGIDPNSHRVEVGPAPSLFKSRFIGDQCTWLTSCWGGEGCGERKQAKVESLRVLAQIRYRHRPAWATLERVERGDGEDHGEAHGPRKVRVSFEEPQRAITPGQFVAFYQGRRLLGGGRIIQIEE